MVSFGRSGRRCTPLRGPDAALRFCGCYPVFCSASHSPPPSGTDRLKKSALREGTLLIFVLFCAGLAALTVFPSNLWSYVLEPDRWPEGTTFWSFYPTMEDLMSRLQYLPEELPRLLTPFPGGIAYHFHSYWSAFLFLGNVGMFLPIGFFTALLWRRGNLWRSTLVGFLASLSIETIQLFIGARIWMT